MFFFLCHILTAVFFLKRIWAFCEKWVSTSLIDNLVMSQASLIVFFHKWLSVDVFEVQKPDELRLKIWGFQHSVAFRFCFYMFELC